MAWSVQLVFIAPWDELGASYSHGDELDKRLCAIVATIGEKRMDPRLVGVVKPSLAAGHGLQMLQAICRAFYPDPSLEDPEKIAAIQARTDEHIARLKSQVETAKKTNQTNLDRLQDDRARLKRLMSTNKEMFMNQMKGVAMPMLHSPSQLNCLLLIQLSLQLQQHTVLNAFLQAFVEISKRLWKSVTMKWPLREQDFKLHCVGTRKAVCVTIYPTMRNQMRI